MPCPRTHHLRKALVNISTGDFLSNLLSCAPRHLRPPFSGRPKSLRSRLGNSKVISNHTSFEPPTLSPTASFLDTVVNAFIAAKCRSKDLTAFAISKCSGETLADSSYSILLKLQYLFELDTEAPNAIIGAMVKSGCNPDAATYSMLISGLCRVGRIEDAWGIVDNMVGGNCPPTVRCFTSIVLGYCNEGRVDEAKILVDRMSNFGCSPDAVTYTILISALCKRGDFDEVGRVLGDSESKGWKPDEVSYNVYMNGLCKAGMVDEAFRLLEVMRKHGLCPKVETLHILFHCLCRDWKYKSLQMAMIFLDWDVDVFFYNTLMSRLCEIGRWQAVFQLWASMVKRGIGTIYTFTIVIHNLCKIRMIGEAKYIFYNMGIHADITAFNTLLFGFNMASEFREVHKLFSDIVRQNVAPNEFTYSIMIDSFCREQNFPGAVNCFLGSIRNGFFPNLITRPIRWLIKDGKRRELLNMFEEMLRRGFILDSFIFDSLIRGFCKVGLCQSVDESDLFYLIFDKMLGIR